jgi:hypothetical protein
MIRIDVSLLEFFKEWLGTASVGAVLAYGIVFSTLFNPIRERLLSIKFCRHLVVCYVCVSFWTAMISSYLILDVFKIHYATLIWIFSLPMGVAIVIVERVLKDEI